MFKLARNADRVHRAATVWAMLSFVADHVASSPSSRMGLKNGTEKLFTTVNYNDAVLHALYLMSYTKKVTYLLRKYSNCKSASKVDTVITNLKKLAGTRLLKYDEAVPPEAIRVKNTFDQGNPNDIFL